MKKRISQLAEIVKTIRSLPKAEIVLGSDGNGQRLYNAFTARHPHYFIIERKEMGVALITLADFENADSYTQSVNGKNSAAYYARKARRAGYTFRAFDPAVMKDAIYAVNTSAGERQGRSMDASYLNPDFQYPADEGNVYYGVFKDNELVAYLWIVYTGELTVLNRLLGHAAHLNDGVMYLLVTAYVEEVLQHKSALKYVMYDTFFGASDGLKLFKTRCGFKAHRVKWKIAENA